MTHVKTKIDRPTAAQIASIAKFGTATLHEAQGRRGAMHPSIKPVDNAMSMCGPAFTAICAPRDNIMLQVAINYAKKGDVLVISAGNYVEAGFFGDVLGNACKAKGLGGLVIDAGVRDSANLRELGFPVFSLGISIRGTVKETLGPINMPVIIGGVLIEPGDIIRGDADGVCVVKRAEADEIAKASEAREAAEADYIAQYKAGKSVIEVSKLEKVLAAKGLVVD